MKLWVITAREEHPNWRRWYDKAFGFVVRAPDEQSARRIAASCCGDEKPESWFSGDCSDCVELTQDGEQELILRDFASA